MAQFKGFSYDEYVKPLEHLQKVHNETLADMNNMSSQSDILDYYLDPERDKQSYNLYNNFKQEFNKQADDFARNGLTRSNGMNLLRLHRNYNNNVANVLDALKNKKAEEAAQMAAQEKNNGQMVYSSYAHDKSVDDYLRGKMGYREQNLDEVHKFAKNEAAAASGREYTDNIADEVKALGNMYYHIRTQKGFDNSQAYDIINGLMQDAENRLQWNGLNDIDSKDSPLGFIRNMRAELQKRGIENYSNEDQDKIIDAFLTGTYEGLKLDITNDFKDTPEMRKAGRANTSVKVYTGQTEKVDTTDFNENEIVIKSTFEDVSSKRERENIIKGIEDGDSDFFGDKKVLNGYIKTLLSYDDWAEKKYAKDIDNFNKMIESGAYKPMSERNGEPMYDENGEVQYGVYTVDDETKEPYLKPVENPKKASREKYDAYLKKLATIFYLSEDELNQLKQGENAKTILTNALNAVENLKKARVQPAYELIIPGEQTGGVLESTRIRARSKGYTGAQIGLGIDPSTGKYTFTDKVDGSSLDKFYNAPGAKQKGMLCQLIYAPQTWTDKAGVNHGDLFQVAFCSTVWDEPIFFPLSAFASQSNAAEVAEIENARKRSEIMMEKLKEQLGITDDKKLIEEINEQIRIGKLQQDYLKKSILRKTSQRGQIKDNKMFGDIFEADIKTLEPVKYKEKKYNQE